ncbi:hypothetical protein LCGC14_2881360 [marine sediment metagenome]|uniref:DUF2188 domain-containing protein n=1 Tax=marine sediment metagenome TaxID=412755 RepID=A0A0F9A7Z1_9ZZZZ
MPAVVRKHGSHYDIVDKNTGKVKGHSTTKAQAQKSANARNAAHFSGGKWKPTKK